MKMVHALRSGLYGISINKYKKILTSHINTNYMYNHRFDLRSSLAHNNVLKEKENINSDIRFEIVRQCIHILFKDYTIQMQENALTRY